MGLFQKIQKALRNVNVKNRKKTGHSARNGNRPSCYQKFKKKPYQYSFKSKKVGQTSNDNTKRYLEAAE